MKQNHTLGWFIPLRLAQYILIFGLFSLWLNFPVTLVPQIIIYSVLTLSFTILLAFDKKQKYSGGTLFIIGAQFIVELVIEAGIVYDTGHINSPFTILFLLTIISAALTYRLIGTLLLASLVSFIYAFVVWIGFDKTTENQLSLQALKSVYTNHDSIFYSVFLHILIFYLVAFIAGYLAGRLRQRDIQLADTSRALKKARLETDDILKHLNSGLLTVDASGRIVYFNRSAEKILGYREEDVKGLLAQDIFNERMPEFATALTDGLDKRIEHPRKEISIFNTDGDKVPVGLSTSILTEENYDLRGIIAIFSDLTDAKKLEEKVRSSDRLAAIGELSASIAHEIRNPLAAIAGSVEVLKADLHVTDENERLMNLIVKESDRLTNMLNEFLLYAKIDRVGYEKVELCHLISEVFDIVRHQPCFHEKINLHFESTESIVYAVGDDRLCKQLLLNLVVNACEAIGWDDGAVTVSLRLNNETKHIMLLVADTGPGIPQEQLSEIYKPFYSTKKTGTGLGLAIVHRICATMKIPLSVDTRPGEGTRFMLELSPFTIAYQTAPELSKQPVA